MLRTSFSDNSRSTTKAVSEQRSDYAERRLGMNALCVQRSEAVRPVMRDVDQLLVEVRWPFFVSSVLSSVDSRPRRSRRWQYDNESACFRMVLPTISEARRSRARTYRGELVRNN